MADTKTRAKRDDDDTTTTAGEQLTGTTSTNSGDTDNTGDVSPAQDKQDAGEQQGPKPAETYAGSGTTEPVKLNPETHGAYARTTGTI